MAVPLRQAMRVGSYVARQRLRRNEKFALVLQLEPLYQCNLACAGCGKIQHEDAILQRRLTVQQCIDAATDQMLQSSAGPFSAPACPEREVKKSDSGTTIDSRCNFNGKAASAHAVITGSFDSAYTMTVTSEGADLPAMTMTSEGKWLGACAAGQQPGDVVMANGVKVNIPELQKRAGAPDPSQPGK